MPSDPPPPPFVLSPSTTWNNNYAKIFLDDPGSAYNRGPNQGQIFYYGYFYTGQASGNDGNGNLYYFSEYNSYDPYLPVFPYSGWTTTYYANDAANKGYSSITAFFALDAGANQFYTSDLEINFTNGTSENVVYSTSYGGSGNPVDVTIYSGLNLTGSLIADYSYDTSNRLLKVVFHQDSSPNYQEFDYSASGGSYRTVLYTAPSAGNGGNVYGYSAYQSSITVPIVAYLKNGNASYDTPVPTSSSATVSNPGSQTASFFYRDPNYNNFVGYSLSQTNNNFKELPPGFFHTVGNQIVDQLNNPVRIAAVTWYGLDSNWYAPDGLGYSNTGKVGDYNTYTKIIDKIQSLGFNTIRLPISQQLLENSSRSNFGLANGNQHIVNYNENGALFGANGFTLNGIQLLDAIVAYAKQDGLKIILDMQSANQDHAADGTPAPSHLPYMEDQSYQTTDFDSYQTAHPDTSYTDWVTTWSALAQHYTQNYSDTVIGADLFNEPRSTNTTTVTWGTLPSGTVVSGNTFDWHNAAVAAGNAIQSVNPNWLIFVQGTDGNLANSAENLTKVAQTPVNLNVANQVVYSPHVYSAVANGAGPENFTAADLNQEFGYIYEQNIAPIFVSEFGTENSADPYRAAYDVTWMKNFEDYMNDPAAGYATPGADGWTVNAPRVPGTEGMSSAYFGLSPGAVNGGLFTDWSTLGLANVGASTTTRYSLVDQGFFSN